MNSAIGEVKINLGGRDWVLRPSFAAIEEMESTTKRGVVELLMTLKQGTYRISDMAAVVRACMAAALPETDHCPTLRQVGEWTADEGVFTVVSVAVGLLTYILNKQKHTGEQPSGEKKAQ
jgi:hypothetical protein